jgi:hypothetical protein
MTMTIGEHCIQLPDGEELVVIDRADWLASTPGPDPRETALDLRRQVSVSVDVRPSPSVSSARSTT